MSRLRRAWRSVQAAATRVETGLTAVVVSMSFPFAVMVGSLDSLRRWEFLLHFLSLRQVLGVRGVQ